MSLKLATLPDLPHILRMCRAFYEETPYAKSVSYNDSKVESLFLDTLAESYQRSLFLLYEVDQVPVGLIVGYATATPFSDDKVAAELAWWVDHEYRGSKGSIELVLAYEDWAKRVGCKHITMSLLPSLTNPKIEKYYDRLGYKQVEITYVKEI